MNRNVKRAVIGSIAGVVAAAGGAWYVMAGNIVTGTKASLERFNGKTHADGSSLKITYDGLERTTFPAIGVRLVNPVIELNSPGVAAPKPQEGVVAQSTPPQPFHVVWKHSGTIDIITDYLAHGYRVVNDGSGKGSLESGMDTVTLGSAPAHSEASLIAKNNEAFAQWRHLNFSDDAAVKQALSQIGGAHIVTGAMKLTNATTGAVLLTQEEAKLDFTNASDAKKINFDLAFISKGSQVTKEYTDLMTHVMKIMNLPTSAIDGSMPMAASRAGKQDIDIAMNVDLPSTPMGQQTPTGTIHVTKFSIKNDFYALQTPLDVVLDENATRRHAAIKLNWTLDITPAGAQEMQVLLDGGLPMAPAFLAGAKDVDPALLKQKILAALPTVSTLGPVTFALDVDASVPKPGATGPDAKEALALRQFTFGHKRWGLEAKGEAHRDAATHGSTISGTLTCKQCTTLTQDLYATAMAVQDVMALTKPGLPPLPISEATLTQLNSTLGELGKPGAATGDLDFVVTTPTPDDVRLNDKPASEVMAKLMMVFLSPPPAASAPAAPVAAPGKPASGAPAI